MRVLFIDSVHPILQEGLSAMGFECHFAYENSESEILALLPDYQGAVIRSKFKFTAEVIDKAWQLKFIARSGSGMENIDVEYAQKKGIQCFNSPEGNRDAVAEQVVGMLLMLFNNLKRADSEVRAGIWRREENRGIEIKGKTIGLIGYGVMGKATAKRLAAFDCAILAYDKYKKNYGSKSVKEASIDEIFEYSDVVSLHVPLSEETQFMVNSLFLNSFKKPIYLINTSRGQVLKIADLNRALKSGKVKGACLDVLEFEKTSFENIETNKDFKTLSEFENVILSPHIAGWTVESYQKLSAYLLAKIQAAF